VIIGGNAAGPAAAAKAKRILPDAEVTLIEKRGVISTGTCEIPYLFSGEVKDPKHLRFYNEESFFQSKGVAVHTKHTAEFIDTRKKTVITRSADTGKEKLFSYDALVLSTGSSARVLPMLPSGLSNTFSVKTIEDADAFFGSNLTLRDKRILIVGAGLVGIEMADALYTAGAQVTVADLVSLPLSSADPDIRKMVSELLTHHGIRFLQVTQSAQYLVKENLFTGVRVSGVYHEFDMMFIASGTEPQSQLAQSSGLKLTELNTIQVDNRLQTSQSGIFAAGDCISGTDFITNRPRYDLLATTARNSGHIAGENAAGGRGIFPAQVRNVSMRVPGGYLLTVGISIAEAEFHKIPIVEVRGTANSHVPVMPSSREVYGKLLTHKHNKMIVGASFLGGPEVSGYGDMVSLMIRGRIPAALLEDVNFNYTPPLSPFINLLSILGRKSKQL